MKRLMALSLCLALLSPVAALAQGRGRSAQSQTAGRGTKLRQRIHTPGTGRQSGTAIRQRDRKRDGTGVNCPSAPCTGTPKAQVAPKK